MLAALVLGLTVIMRCWPELPVVRQLHAMLAEAPARALARATRTHLIFALLLVAIVIGAAEYLAMAGPLDAGLALVWDLAMYVDVVAATVVIAVVARGRAGWAWLRAARGSTR